MRPIPRTRHLQAVLILAAVSATAGYFAMLDTRLSDSQVHIASVAAKRANGELYRYDDVLGDSNRWRFQTPAFQAMLEMLLVPTGYQDLALPFRAMAGVVVMIYLCGMYALLYRQCRSWSVSVYVAVLSAAVTNTLGRSYWGVGPLATITPPTIIASMTPLIILSYLRYERQWRVMLVFAFIGLCGNLHLVTAMNLTVVMLIAYLARCGFHPRCWPMAAACLMCAAAAALPYAGYYAHLRYAAEPTGAHISADVVYQAFRLGNLALMYPDMLKSLLYWLGMVAVLLIPAVAVLTRVERFRVRDLSLWVAMAGASLTISLVWHGICQLIGTMRDEPPVIAFAQASNLAMLPLYVLFAQALTHLFRIVRAHRYTLRWACAAFLVVWMLPSDNLRVLRHWAYDAAAAVVDDEHTPLRVQELRTRAARQRELAAVADWARHATPVDAVFITEEAEFRMLAQRGILAAEEDLRYYYYVTPWQLQDWVDRVVAQAAALRSPAGRVEPQALADLAVRFAPRPPGPPPQWYAIIPAAAAPEPAAPLEEVTGSGWGTHYRLYRVR